jgi:hypothetical protein
MACLAPSCFSGAFERCAESLQRRWRSYVPIRVVVEDLRSLTVRENQIAYGAAIQDNSLKNALFCLLAEALAGRDPELGLDSALRYYGGPQLSEFFAAGRRSNGADQFGKDPSEQPWKH